MKKLRFPILSFIILTLIFSTQAVFATDIGPKPSMEFEFQQDTSGENISITSGILYECQQADCSDAAPLAELGPQRFWCEEFHCSAISYGFAPYHRIELQFSDDKTRSSNIFETVDFDSHYRVTVQADDLAVAALSGLPAPTEKPFPEEPKPVPTLLLGVGGLLCIGLILLLIASVVIFFVLRSRKK